MQGNVVSASIILGLAMVVAASILTVGMILASSWSADSSNCVSPNVTVEAQ